MTLADNQSTCQQRRRATIITLRDRRFSSRLSRYKYDFTESMYIGVEAMYQNMQSATTANGLAPAGAIGSATTQVSSEGNWNFTLRMHKDFLP